MEISEVTEPTTAGSAEMTSWYAVHTRSRHEKRIASELQARGITTFLPLVTETHKWSDRKMKVEIPLFSCYLFVNITASAEARVSILRASGVLNLLGGNHQGTAIPEGQIQNIQMILSKKVPFVSHAFLEIGQTVRVRGGPLNGIEGIITRCNGSNRLVISVNTIQRSLSISVEGYQLELVQPTKKLGAESKAKLMQERNWSHCSARALSIG
jgi:transcription antitermination factor NusG